MYVYIYTTACSSRPNVWKHPTCQTLQKTENEKVKQQHNTHTNTHTKGTGTDTDTDTNTITHTQPRQAPPLAYA